MKITTHDIVIDDKTYILEWMHSENSEPARIAITEATTCNPEHEDDEQCDGCEYLETYEFVEGL